MNEYAIAFTVFFASFLQANIGFGFGLFSIPLFMLAGATLPQAIFLVAVNACIQSLIASFSLRHNIPWKSSLTAAGIRMLTIPLGMSLLIWIQQLSEDVPKQVVGVAILLVILSRLTFKPLPREKIHQGWSFLAFATSGLMAGSLGIGGPPMVLWVTALNWEAIKIRAFLISSFCITLIYQVGLFWIKFENDRQMVVELSFFTIPLLLLGTYFGLLTGSRLSTKKLRFSAYLVLAIIALNAILQPYWQ